MDAKALTAASENLSNALRYLVNAANGGSPDVRFLQEQVVRRLDEVRGIITKP